MILSARLAPWNVGEQSLAEEPLPEVVNQFRAMGQERLLFIDDSGYPSIKFICNVLSVYRCEKQGAWELDNIPEYRLNFSVLFGVMRDKIFQAFLGNYSSKKIDVLFNRAANRAKVKLRPGRSYSREKVGKPKRHHTFRRIC